MNQVTKFLDRRKVVEEDLDDFRHVNNLQYLRWTLCAASAHSRHVGWSSQRYRDLGSGWLVRSHQITYKVPALLDDEIVVRTWVDSFDRVSSVRKYEIVREADQSTCAFAETRWVFVDFATQKLTAIPSDVKAAFGF